MIKRFLIASAILIFCSCNQPDPAEQERTTASDPGVVIDNGDTLLMIQATSTLTIPPLTHFSRQQANELGNYIDYRLAVVKVATDSLTAKIARLQLSNSQKDTAIIALITKNNLQDQITSQVKVIAAGAATEAAKRTEIIPAENRIRMIETSPDVFTIDLGSAVDSIYRDIKDLKFKYSTLTKTPQ